MYTYKHVYIQTCIHTNMYTYKHVYIQTCIHTLMKSTRTRAYIGDRRTRNHLKSKSYHK